MWKRWIAGITLVAAAAMPATARDSWVASWASAQMVPQGDQVVPTLDFKNSTLRQLVRVSLGGRELRVRLSNAFGREPLTINGASVGVAVDPASPKLRPGTSRPLRFGGATAITIPAGAEFVSDPVALPVAALTTLAVSIHFRDHPSVVTSHPGSRATSYIGKGDQLASVDFSSAATVDHWYQLTGVDVLATSRGAAIALLGDSITDGFGVKPNTNARWSDTLIRRLQASPRTRHLSVLNLGIGGNRILLDGLGPNAVARFERDVLMRDGVKYLLILEGVNDLGTLTRDAPVSAEEHRAFVRRLLTGYAQIVARARDKGIKVIGATILPYGASAYYHPTAANEADRQAINAWIRAQGNVDAVVDFDAVTRDPARPERMRKELDSGDGLHPSLDGYRLMGEAVPLSLFR
nr:SGNH/GDSL hydrolase family protein [Sphingomonas piscis]